MKRNKLLVFFAILLVVVIGTGLFVGCAKVDTSGGGVTSVDNQPNADKGPTVIVDEADSLQVFGLHTTTAVADIRSFVTVSQLSNGVTIPVTFGKKELTDTQFVINPPAGGYKIGTTYKISLGEGVNFDAYPNAKNLIFTVTSNLTENVKFNSGVLEYNSNLIIGEINKTGSAEDGSEVGNFNFQTNGSINLEVGDVMIINNQNTKSAYKVAKIDKTSNPNVVAISYTKPNVDEVYSDFKFEEKTKLTNDSEIDFVYEKDGGNAMEKSQLATSIVSIFGQKPKFNVTANKLDNGVRAVVSITIPDVVKIDGFGTSSITISITNDLTCNADTKMLLQEVVTGIKEANFGIATEIKNTTTCSVKLDANANFSKVQNAQELLEKLHKLANQGEQVPAGDLTNEDVANDIDKVVDGSQNSTGAGASACIPLFKWAVPLAGGAIVVDYDADLVFRFNFSGQFELAATGSLEYAVGVTYDTVNGVKVVTENIKQSDKFMDDIDITMAGVATVKVGVIQKVGINLLAGVISARISAEIGNYNRLYGYAQTNNLLSETEKYIVGSIYFDGGFYYDVNLLLGIKLGPINIADQAIKITSGEISLYNAGNKELELGMVNSNPVWKLNALENTLPEYKVSCYDLVTSARYQKTADPKDLKVVVNTTDLNNIEYVNDKLVVRNHIGFEGATISVQYKDFPAVTTKVSFSGAFYADKTDFSFDKKESSRADIKINLTSVGNNGNPITIKSGDIVLDNDYKVDSYDATTTLEQGTLTILKKELCKLPEGQNEVIISSGNYSIKLNVNVVGKLSWNGLALNNQFILCNPEQIESMSNTYTDFANKTFVLTNDIDMREAKLAPIPQFAGTLLGGGYTISNYTIETMNGNEAGFIAVNTGVIQNITFAGNMNITFSGKFNNTYNFGGVVAVNSASGSLTNVKYTGTMNVNSDAIASGITYNFGAIAATTSNSLKLVDCDATGATMNVKAKFALVNTTYNLGGLTADSKGNATINFSNTYGVLSTMKVNIYR